MSIPYCNGCDGPGPAPLWCNECIIKGQVVQAREVASLRHDLSLRESAAEARDREIAILRQALADRETLADRESASADVWREFLSDEQMICGLCGNLGWIDTRGIESPTGVPCGVKRPCLCPNGRSIKQLRNLPATLEDRPACNGTVVHDPTTPCPRCDAR